MLQLFLACPSLQVEANCRWHEGGGAPDNFRVIAQAVLDDSDHSYWWSWLLLTKVENKGREVERNLPK